MPEEKPTAEQIAEKLAEGGVKQTKERVTSGSTQTTKHGAQTTTQTQGDDVTTTRKELDDDAYNKAIERAQAEHDYVYGPGNAMEPTTASILGVDYEKMRKKRDQDIELNKRRTRLANMYNSLAVLGDMITTGIGGNVWKRDPAKVDDYIKDNKEMEALTRAEDAALAQAQAKYKADKAKDLSDRIARYVADAYTQTSTAKKGDKTTNVVKGDDVVNSSSWRNTTKDVLSSDDDGNGGGSGNSRSSRSGSGRGGGKTYPVSLAYYEKDENGLLKKDEKGNYYVKSKYLGEIDQQGYERLKNAVSYAINNDKDTYKRLVEGAGGENGESGLTTEKGELDYDKLMVEVLNSRLFTDTKVSDAVKKQIMKELDEILPGFRLKENQYDESYVAGNNSMPGVTTTNKMPGVN